MDEVFKYGKRDWYPHMKPADIAIWERFIAANPTAYETCQYDVAVGSPPPFDPTVIPETGGSAEALYRRKIDVVGRAGSVIHIIEVKPAASTSALGQVKGYVSLYKRDVDPKANPQPVVVTDRLMPDMKQLAEEAGVLLIVV